MSRRLLAATALALLLPLVGAAAQTRVTGVLRGSLVLLAAPTGTADVSPAGERRVSAVRAPMRGPIRAVVSAAQRRLTVWAPAAERVELRVQGDTVQEHMLECHRAVADSAAPATCDAAEALPARATLTVYFGLDGSR
jgi:hypothetical protein